MNAAEIAAMKQEIACARAAVEGVARLRNKIAALTLDRDATAMRAKALREALDECARELKNHIRDDQGFRNTSVQSVLETAATLLSEPEVGK